jgi:hypothetical protein
MRKRRRAPTRRATRARETPRRSLPTQRELLCDLMLAARKAAARPPQSKAEANDGQAGECV